MRLNSHNVQIVQDKMYVGLGIYINILNDKMIFS